MTRIPMTQTAENVHEGGDTAVAEKAAANPLRIRKEALLLALDLAVCAASPFAAIAIRYAGGLPDLHVLPYLTFLPVLLAWRIFAAHSFGLYDFKHRLNAMEHTFGGVGAALLAVAGGYVFLAVAQLYYFPETYLSRAAAAIDAGLLAAWFGFSRAATLGLSARLGARVRVLLAGNATARGKLTAMLREAAAPLLLVSEWDAEDGLEDPSKLKELEARLRQGPIDQVVLAGVQLDQAALRDVLALCDRLEVEAYLYPDLDSACLLYTSPSPRD